MRISDWSSDVCSSDLLRDRRRKVAQARAPAVAAGKSEVEIIKPGCEAGAQRLPPGAAFVVGHASQPLAFEVRSEERRVGQEGVSTCRSRWSPQHHTKKERHTATSEQGICEGAS